ncbi:hypothetical protein [Photobacterium makurazakiensis]|uniref:hypothetical protein n=1 Tax=Photobacterium makurazakiensis TaxID=2910234 RepID=UPI003D0E76E4
MEYDFRNHPFVKLAQVNQYDEWVKQFQSAVSAGNTVESTAIMNAKEALEQSYQNTLNILESLDKQYFPKQKESERLCFPFDVMDMFTRNATEHLSVMTGQAAQTANEQFSEQEKQIAALVAIEAQLNLDLGVIKSKLVEESKLCENAKIDADKAHKAKLTAQRQSRKLKADLDIEKEQYKQAEQQAKALQAELSKSHKEAETLTKTNESLANQVAELEQQLMSLKQHA